VVEVVEKAAAKAERESDESSAEDSFFLMFFLHACDSPSDRAFVCALKL